MGIQAKKSIRLPTPTMPPCERNGTPGTAGCRARDALTISKPATIHQLNVAMPRIHFRDTSAGTARCIARAGDVGQRTVPCDPDHGISIGPANDGIASIRSIEDSGNMNGENRMDERHGLASTCRRMLPVPNEIRGCPHRTSRWRGDTSHARRA
ncbi:MAG: hypothetical protein KH616_03645 [Burkholderia sp.]|nr:hypothetical protein [Burkholderia sp.]